MAFIKVKDKKGKEDAIINTDMIRAQRMQCSKRWA